MTHYCGSPVVATLSIPSGPTLDLMDDQQGFRLGVLDLGYPDMREDLYVNANRPGAADLTQFFGARPVTIQGGLVPSPAGSRQKAFHLLAPFLNPAARPVLTYQVDADAITKTITLRPAQLAAPMSNPSVSEAVSLGFKAADPFAYDANVQTAIVWVSVTGGGRVYAWTPNRSYPPGGVSYVTTSSAGDFNAYPLLRMYGPITNGYAQTNIYPAGGGQTNLALGFQNGYAIPAGSYVALDCKARTAYLNGDPTQNVYGNLVFGSGWGWPWIPPGGYTAWTLNGTGTSNATQLQVVWADAYLL